MLGRSWTLESLRESRSDGPHDPWPEAAVRAHARFWEARLARQKEIDASIAATAEFETLHDKPYEDGNTVRVAGPFTVESLSPHRVVETSKSGELRDPVARDRAEHGAGQDFDSLILENLRKAGVQQSRKKDRIRFTDLKPWPGEGGVAAEGWYVEGGEDPAGARDAQVPSASSGSASGNLADEQLASAIGGRSGGGRSGAVREKRAAVFIGPEFGTVARSDLARAAREAAEMRADVLIACAFSYDAHASDFRKYGAMPILKATMNADLHMAEDLANTGAGNLFVIFGEPDIEILADEADPDRVRVRIRGVDVYDPAKGEVRSDDTGGIACWFIDTDYNDESFFVRQAYFLGAADPYKSLRTTLKSEIDAEAWESLQSDVSRSFPKPRSGRIAVKVINHLGDEVMRVYQV